MVRKTTQSQKEALPNPTSMRYVEKSNAEEQKEQWLKGAGDREMRVNV